MKINLASLKRHKWWWIGGGAALAILYYYKTKNASTSGSTTSGAANPIQLTYPSTSQGNVASTSDPTTSTPSTIDPSIATQLTQLEQMDMALYNQINQPASQPSTQTGPIISTITGETKVASSGVNSAGQSNVVPMTIKNVNVPAPVQSVPTVSNAIEITKVVTNQPVANTKTTVPTKNNANGMGIPTAYVQTGSDHVTANAIVRVAKQTNQYAVQDPNGNVSVSSNYNAAVNTAGGQYENHQWIQGAYVQKSNGSSTFTPGAISQQQENLFAKDEANAASAFKTHLQSIQKNQKTNATPVKKVSSPTKKASGGNVLKANTPIPVQESRAYNRIHLVP